MLNRPLSPDEIRALIRWKGWSHKDLAAYWQVSQVHVSRIVNNPARALHWNDAVVGLPRRGRLASDIASRHARAKALADGKTELTATAPRSGTTNPAVPGDRAEEEWWEAEKPDSGYRYRGYMVVGAIVTVSHDLNDEILLGERGIVFAATDTGVGERYGVIFESGIVDWFLPLDVDNHLANTGLDAPGVAHYVFESERALERDFADGLFQFW